MNESFLELLTQNGTKIHLEKNVYLNISRRTPGGNYFYLLEEGICALTSITKKGEEAVFLVNTGQVRCGGDLYVKGVNILEAIRDLGGGGGCTCDSYTCSEDSCGGGDECGAAYSGGGCGCDNDGSGCTCHGYYDVPGCDVVQGCPTDS